MSRELTGAAEVLVATTAAGHPVPRGLRPESARRIAAAAGSRRPLTALPPLEQLAERL